MPNLGPEALRELYFRGLLELEAVRGLLERLGPLPAAFEESFLGGLSAARDRFRDELRAGTSELPRPWPWLPEPVWLLAIRVIRADRAGAELVAAGWAPEDVGLWIGLGAALQAEVDDAIARAGSQSRARTFPE